MGNVTAPLRPVLTGCRTCDAGESAEASGSHVEPLAQKAVVSGDFNRELSNYVDDAMDREHQGLHPAFQNGDVVEYYSPTHKIWLVGVMQLEMEKSKKIQKMVFTYNVYLKKSGQIRHRVPLDMIRAPFQPTELIEVFSKRNAGQWLTGAIRGPVATGSIMKGYKVFVDKQEGSPEMLLEKVPSWRVRRRFPPRSNIEVYRGPLHGWMPGVVHSVITEFAAEPPVALSPFSPGCSDDPEPFVPEVPGQQPPQVANESSDWHREDAATVCGSTVAGDEGVSVLPWMQVPVYVEEWDEAEWGHDPDLERAQWVPSYLIRMRMIRLASTNESRRDDRRSFMM